MCCGVGQLARTLLELSRRGALYAQRSPPLSLATLSLVQQRPLAPIRPIPSQRWCDNFPKKEKEEEESR